MTEAQAKILKSVGIQFPFLWAVVGDFTQKFAVMIFFTGEIKVIDKE